MARCHSINENAKQLVFRPSYRVWVQVKWLLIGCTKYTIENKGLTSSNYKSWRLSVKVSSLLPWREVLKVVQRRCIAIANYYWGQEYAAADITDNILHYRMWNKMLLLRMIKLMLPLQHIHIVKLCKATQVLMQLTLTMYQLIVDLFRV